jgi:hypothetical protein
MKIAGCERRHSASLGSIPIMAENFAMERVCRSLSGHSFNNVQSNNISNSSLRDVDRGALKDELSTYMEEILNRENA